MIILPFYSGLSNFSQFLLNDIFLFHPAFARLRLLIIKQSYFITFIRNNQAFFCKFSKKFLYKKICSSVFFNR